MIAAAYGNDFLIKGFLAAAILVSLIASGKANLLKVLNVCMLGVVLWTGGWVLTYL